MADLSLIGFALSLFILAILAARKNKSLGDKGMRYTNGLRNQK